MQKKLNELEKEFTTDLSGGLNEQQVKLNQESFGKNELEAKKKTNIFVKFLLEFKDILIIILLIAALISVIVDPSEWVESVIIVFVVIVNALLGVYQENRAEKSLEALQKMTSPSAKIIRNNALITIPSKDVVVGDILLVEAGDNISADATIIESTNLQVEEAALTGESVPVNKNNKYIEADDVALGDRRNCLFSSTYVTNGKAKAVVTSVGMNTEIGKIAGMLNDTDNTLTPLQKKLAQVGKMIGILALLICVVVFVLELLSSSDIANNWVESFKTAIALAVAAIPEGLATVVTVVLAIGVGKMSKQNAIVKKLPAVETLGCTNVVCSDKTGTLTQNRMTVVKIYNNKLKAVEDLTTDEQLMLSYFAICCDASINRVNGKVERIGDPTELALLDVNYAFGKDISKEKRILDIPFDSERKLMTTVINKNEEYIAITKGAPDIVLDLATNDPETINKATIINKDMAESALRVLALGIKKFAYMPTVDELEHDLTFIGLVGMIDPARDEVKASIALAHKAGIKTVMITGDHVITATAIAKELGILGENDKTITSKELERLDDSFLEKHIGDYAVYARVAPKDKVRIVEAWQKNNAVVAMTGDGVNDAPALKKADIGCAMGITGTDVSKEAADMILVDDNFATIISAVKQGRGIYDNIRKCVKYLLSSNIGEVLTIFIASLLSAFGLNLGVPLASIHLLWINLITDSLPAFGIGMEDVEDEVMSRTPKKKNESFFAEGLTWRIIVEGIIIGAVTLIAYLIGNMSNHAIGQTMAFFTLSSTQLFHAYNVKSKHSIFSKYTFRNKFMNFAFLVGFALQFLVIYLPGVNTIFELSALSIDKLAISFGLSLVIVVVMEITKLVQKMKNEQNTI